jgi:hypothetical protein
LVVLPAGDAVVRACFTPPIDAYAVIRAVLVRGVVKNCGARTIVLTSEKAIAGEANTRAWTITAVAVRAVARDALV